MSTGNHLGLSLCLAGIYALAIRIRYYKLEYSWPLVIGLMGSLTMEMAAGILFGTMYDSPPPNPPNPPPPGCPPCSAPSPTIWEGIIGVLCTILIPLMAIIAGALPPPTNRPKILWRTSLAAVIIWLISSTVFNEFMVFANSQFAEEAGAWGLGQYLAVLMVVGQTLDSFNYLREPYPSGQESRFYIWWKEFRQRGDGNGDVELPEAQQNTIR
jgi:hypothetical protein